MQIASIGHGAGTMKLKGGPNVLRVLIGTRRRRGGARTEADHVVELQTNLDDVSGEVVGHACRLLREAGALDVWTVPAMMKKERPAVVMHVLVSPEREEELLTPGCLPRPAPWACGGRRSRVRWPNGAWSRWR